ELVLSTTEGRSEAVVQYTIPASAWKISYRLSLNEEGDIRLQGFAVVDNNTEEDWSDFQVCVVTGEPITFSTDLASSKTPSRKHVNLVNDLALGSVEVESPPMVMAGAAGEAVDGMVDDSLSRGRLRGGRQMMARRVSAPESRGIVLAETEQADVQEVGDFSVFESESVVTIPAKRSTVIPMFNVEIGEAKSVLHYKHANHAERAYRSVDLKNQADFSLGRGVCTVFEEAAYSGSCIIPALKPGESQLLPHALETGVKIHRDRRRQRNKIVGLQLSKGFCNTSRRQRREFEYHIKNSRDQIFTLVLDHEYALSEPEIVSTLVQDGKEEDLEIASKLSEGVRFSISLEAKSEVVIRVLEHRIDETRVELISVSQRQENVQIDWLEKNLVKTDGPLAKDEGVQRCLEINDKLESVRRLISDAVKETEVLAERQERLRQNIKSGGQDDFSIRWRNELDESENAIRDIEDERLPKLRDREQAVYSDLKLAIKSLSVDWLHDG
ncbi:MAG: DUF4139 domain-containing protein, partial [Planctomycetota bacterium]